MCISAGPPTITSVSSDITSIEGSKVSLICNATNDIDALDDVTIVWLRKISKDLKEEIKLSENIHNKTDYFAGKIHSVLLFNAAAHTDDGKYICRALNHPLSYSEKTISMVIECKQLLHLYIQY